MARLAAVPGIGPAQGVDAFARLLAGANDRVVVTAFDLQAAVAASRNREAVAVDEEVSNEPASALGDRSQVSLGGAFTPLSEGPERILGEIWSELVGIAIALNSWRLAGHRGVLWKGRRYTTAAS